MKKPAVCLAWCLWCAPLFAANPTDEELLQNIPPFQCTLTAFYGTVATYLPPKSGDAVRVDFHQLMQQGGKLDFTSGNYIPLAEPLKLVKLTRGPDLQHLNTVRFRSGNWETKGQTFDLNFNNAGGPKENAHDPSISILSESGQVDGWIILRCKPDK